MRVAPRTIDESDDTNAGAMTDHRALADLVWDVDESLIAAGIVDAWWRVDPRRRDEGDASADAKAGAQSWLVDMLVFEWSPDGPRQNDP